LLHSLCSKISCCISRWEFVALCDTDTFQVYQNDRNHFCQLTSAANLPELALRAKKTPTENGWGFVIGGTGAIELDINVSIFNNIESNKSESYPISYPYLLKRG
jgi:hypothetical protein